MAVSVHEYEKALTALKEAIVYYGKENILQNQKIIRDAVIQRFEFSFELAWKVSLKTKGAPFTAPKDAIREMARWGLIDDPIQWFLFLEARNDPSHSYDEDVAQKVFQISLQFVSFGEQLLLKLKTDIN